MQFDRICHKTYLFFTQRIDGLSKKFFVYKLSIKFYINLNFIRLNFNFTNIVLSHSEIFICILKSCLKNVKKIKDIFSNCFNQLCDLFSNVHSTNQSWQMVISKYGKLNFLTEHAMLDNFLIGVDLDYSSYQMLRHSLYT